MDNKILKNILRIIVVILSLIAFFFQLVNLFLGTMVKNGSEMLNDYWYYGTELIPHVFTIIIIIWFIIFQVREIINK